LSHIIVIYLENHSFDNLFGFFPALTESRPQARPRSRATGTASPDFLPPAMDMAESECRIDPRFPENLPNEPFNIGAYVPSKQKPAIRSIAFSISKYRSMGGAWTSS
jgi:phospholipase C